MATLPNKIVLYCRQPDEKGVEHAFPVNIDSKSRHETAKKWASGNYYSSQNGQPYNVYEYDNTGFDFIIIDSLEIRGEGGRAYQVIIHHEGHKFRVDLREKSLMEVIMNTGIQAGGRLWGSFCFAVDGAQTYLIRENSEYWKRAKEDTAVRASATIKKSELQVGHLYTSLVGDIGVYVGDVFARDIQIKDDNYIFGKVTKKMFFMRKRNQKDFDSFMQISNPEDIGWSFELKSSHSFKIDEGKVYDPDLTEVINHIKEISNKGYHDVMNELLNAKTKQEYWKWSYAFDYYKKLEISFTKDLNEDQNKLKDILTYCNLYEKYQTRRWW